MERTITIRIKGTWLRYLTVILVTVLVAAPATVWASNTFTDVPDSNIFHDDIDWMADSGVTLGCGNGEYCPDDNVTRQQMSAFMHRLADNQVVDAATAVTAETADLLDGLRVAELSSRAAFDSSDNLDNVDGTALRAFISAPADGFLIINANVNLIRLDTTTNAVSCYVDIDGVIVDGSGRSVEVGGTDSTYEICSTGGAAVVEAGLHAIELEIDSLSTPTLLAGGLLTVVFVPFDIFGDVPTP